MDFNTNTIIAAIAVIIAGLVLLDRIFTRALGREEHLIYKVGSEKLFSEWQKRVERDFDKVEADIKALESTRPTGGELQLATNAIVARVALLEDLMKQIVLKSVASNGRSPPN